MDVAGAHGLFGHLERRAVHIHQYLSTRRSLAGRRSVCHPDVLTNGDSDRHPADIPHRVFDPAWHKVPILIEYAVIGQQDLVIHAANMAVV